MKMMKVSIAVLVFVLNIVSCTSQNLTKEQAYRLIKEYREVKSREQAEKGKIFTPQIEEYWVPYTSLFTSPENYTPQYFIYGNDFTILSITYTSYEAYDKNKKGKTYFVKILETIKGKMVNGSLDTSDTREIDFTYWLVITDKGLKIFGDPDTDDFNILEKDLPLLQKRLMQP